MTLETLRDRVRALTGARGRFIQDSEVAYWLNDAMHEAETVCNGPVKSLSLALAAGVATATLSNKVVSIVYCSWGTVELSPVPWQTIKQSNKDGTASVSVDGPTQYSMRNATQMWFDYQTEAAGTLYYDTTIISDDMTVDADTPFDGLWLDLHGALPYYAAAMVKQKEGDAGWFERFLAEWNRKLDIFAINTDRRQQQVSPRGIGYAEAVGYDIWDEY